MALDKLARLDPRQGRIVELRFFGGWLKTKSQRCWVLRPSRWSGTGGSLGPNCIANRAEARRGWKRRDGGTVAAREGSGGGAWERDACERGGFLDEACAGDAELRSHVEALLASDVNAGKFLAATAMELSETGGAAVVHAIEGLPDSGTENSGEGRAGAPGRSHRSAPFAN
jgi:hypothetical protein